MHTPPHIHCADLWGPLQFSASTERPVALLALRVSVFRKVAFVCLLLEDSWNLPAKLSPSVPPLEELGAACSVERHAGAGRKGSAGFSSVSVLARGLTTQKKEPAAVLAHS